jgi:hypothetical protein
MSHQLKSSQSNRFVTQVITGLSPIAVGAIVLLAAPAQAFQFGFNNISGNSATNALAGQNQLFIDVTDSSGGSNLAANQVLFKFSNTGPAASSITQIYLDNGTSLKTMGAIADSGAGVDFSAATGNLNLPAGNNVGFVSSFGLKANTPVAKEGVNPSEWVSVLFNLDYGKTLQSVLAEIGSGALRFGMHVQAFANGGSEAFVNKPTGVVTTPPPVVVTTPPPVVVTTPPPVVVTTPPPVVVTTPPPVVMMPPAVLVPQIQVPPAPSQKVPEPSTIVALSSMAVGMAMKRRQQRLANQQP